jgi:uncharacterized membrane protein
LLLSKLSTAQKIGIAVAAIFYVFAGTLHFTKPEMYLKIMPPYIPWHLAMVRISGFFEILGGLGLLVPQTRRAAAWGLVVLLIAVFPANLYMATNPIEAGAISIAPILRWGRLPVQVLLIGGSSGVPGLGACSIEQASCSASLFVPLGATRKETSACTAADCLCKPAVVLSNLDPAP